MEKQHELDHINLTVPNLEEAIAFYQNIMGFTVAHRFKNGEKDFVFMTDGTLVYELVENPTYTATVIDHIAYVSEDIVAEYNHFMETNPELITLHLKYVEPLFEHGMDVFFIKGAGNERIEFCQKRKA